MYKKICISLLALLFCMSIRAEAISERPMLPLIISQKMAIACERYPSAAMMFASWMNCSTIRERDMMIADMYRGNQEYTYAFADMVYRRDGREMAWSEFKAMGFNINELKLLDNYFEWKEADRQRQRIAQQQKDFAEWSKAGVPADAEVGQKAKFSVEATPALSQAISRLRSSEPLKININLVIGADGSVSLNAYNSEEARELFEHIAVKVESPAQYVFEDIDRSLPMGSRVTLTIREQRGILDYQEGVEIKQDKKTGRWMLDGKQTIPHRESAEQLLTERINQSGKKGKLYVSYDILESSFVILRNEHYEATTQIALPIS